MKKRQIEKTFTNQLEDKTLEEILEDFDITPVEALMLLFDSGMIDEELLEKYYAFD